LEDEEKGASDGERRGLRHGVWKTQQISEGGRKGLSIAACQKKGSGTHPVLMQRGEKKH